MAEVIEIRSPVSAADIDTILTARDRELHYAAIRERICRRIMEKIAQGAEVESRTSVRMDAYTVDGIETKRLIVGGQVVYVELRGSSSRLMVKGDRL